MTFDIFPFRYCGTFFRCRAGCAAPDARPPTPAPDLLFLIPRTTTYYAAFCHMSRRTPYCFYSTVIIFAHPRPSFHALSFRLPYYFTLPALFSFLGYYSMPLFHTRRPLHLFRFILPFIFIIDISISYPCFDVVHFFSMLFRRSMAGEFSTRIPHA